MLYWTTAPASFQPHWIEVVVLPEKNGPQPRFPTELRVTVDTTALKPDGMLTVLNARTRKEYFVLLARPEIVTEVMVRPRMLGTGVETDVLNGTISVDWLTS